MSLSPSWRILPVWWCETNKASGVYWATWIVGFFVSVSFHVLVRLMGIVSRLLTISGLVSLLSSWQHVSSSLFFQLCGCVEVIRAHVYAKWHYFPSTQHLDTPPPTTTTRPFSAGGLADWLVLFCLGEWPVFHAPLFSPSVDESFEVWLSLTTRGWTVEPQCGW